MNNESNGGWQYRRFKSEVTYVSRCISTETYEEEEVIFLVLRPSDKYWNAWTHPPVQYHALNLITGVWFEFHRNSIIAENAKELLT